jgi:type I restriction enzyme, S subunit
MTAEYELQEVCEIIMGQAPDGSTYNDRSAGLPLIAGAGDFGEDRPNSKKFTTAPTKVCEPGDFILSIRASIGAKIVADERYCLGRGVAALRPKPRLYHRFLWHWLSDTTPELAGKGRGATFKQVNRDDIAEVRIRLPDFESQKRIADILDRADRLRSKRRAALVQIDELKQAIFLDMFGDPESNPKKWEMLPLGQVGEVVTGNTPPRSQATFYGNAIEWVKSDNLNTSEDYVTRSEEGLSESGRAVGRVVPAGSILVTCIAGSPGCIGNSAIADRPVAFNQQINAIVPARVGSSFLYTQLLVGKRLIQRASTNGMKGLVSKTRCEQVRVMVPPKAIREQFGNRFDAIQRLKASQTTSLMAFESLFASLQHRAFRGEL